MGGAGLYEWGEGGRGCERSRRGGALWGCAAAGAAAGSPGRARAGAGAARCHLAAAVAAGGAGRGEAIKVSRRHTCTLRGNFPAAAVAMGGAPAPAGHAPP